MVKRRKHPQLIQEFIALPKESLKNLLDFYKKEKARESLKHSDSRAFAKPEDQEESTALDASLEIKVLKTQEEANRSSDSLEGVTPQCTGRKNVAQGRRGGKEITRLTC